MRRTGIHTPRAVGRILHATRRGRSHWTARRLHKTAGRRIRSPRAEGRRTQPVPTAPRNALRANPRLTRRFHADARRTRSVHVVPPVRTERRRRARSRGRPGIMCRDAVARMAECELRANPHTAPATQLRHAAAFELGAYRVAYLAGHGHGMCRILVGQFRPDAGILGVYNVFRQPG